MKLTTTTNVSVDVWADTTVLSGDVAAAVGELKAKPGGELQVHGSGNLVRWLVDNHLVDEITLLTYPLVVARARGCSPPPARTPRLS
jgi:dihydrofolate reductase